jgi:hypothetical protein
MTEQTRTRELGARSQGKRASLERYRRSQSLARGMSPPTPGRRGPLEYDERGFPRVQRSSSFVQRVARLIGS